MKNYHTLFIILIVILLVGGGVLIYKDLTKSPALNNVVGNQENKNINNNETATLTVKDCGLTENIDVADMFTSNPLTNTSNQTKASLKCMDDALINCQLAKIRLAIKGEGEGVYEIKGKEGQNCLINGPFKEYKTCRISPDFITELETAFKQGSDSDRSIFFTMILGIGMNAMFVPSDFDGSSHPIGPIEIVKDGTTTEFYNYDCR